MKIDYDNTGKILSVGIGDDFQGIEYIHSLPFDFEQAFSLGKYQINLDTLLVEKVEGWIAPEWIAPDGYIPVVREIGARSGYIPVVREIDARSGYIPVAREIDARRLRLALLQLKLLDKVEAAISTLDRGAQIDWEYATEIKENYPLVLALATNLGLDTEAIFTLASSLNVRSPYSSATPQLYPDRLLIPK